MPESSTRSFLDKLLEDYPGEPEFPGQSFPRRLGQYRLVRKLGEGGMGEVFEAVHLHLKRKLAIKFLRDSASVRIERFFQEMEALGKLDHPQIIRATDADQWQGRPFLVMELLEGGNLSEVVGACGVLKVPDACAILLQACLGLQCVHEANLVHRDLKPSNIFLTKEGETKILDLGLVRLQDENSGEGLTQSGEIMGTYDFMAPEQAEDSRQATVRADLYSLGCTLYYLLVGKAPFSGPGMNAAKKILAHATEQPPSILELRSGLPPQVPYILGKLLAKDPQKRFADPASLARELAPLAEGSDLTCLANDLPSKPGTDPEVTPGAISQTFGPSLVPKPTAHPSDSCARNRMWPWAVGASILVIILVTVLLKVFFFKEGETTTPKVVVRAENWQDLLALKPQLLLKPKNSFQWNHDPKNSELWFDTGGLSLIQLAEVHETNYQVEFKFQRNLHAGDVGLFFGYRKFQEKNAPESSRWFTIRVSHNPQADAGKPTQVDFIPTTLNHQTGDRSSIQQYAAHLPELSQQEHSLGLVVRQGHLTRIYLDHNELLESWPPEERPGDEALLGGLGVYCGRGAATIKSAHLSRTGVK